VLVSTNSGVVAGIAASGASESACRRCSSAAALRDSFSFIFAAAFLTVFNFSTVAEELFAFCDGLSADAQWIMANSAAQLSAARSVDRWCRIKLVAPRALANRFSLGPFAAGLGRKRADGKDHRKAGHHGAITNQPQWER
jgi:hypothetical protein